MLLGFSDYREQSEHLAEFLGFPFALVKVHYFPDEECKVTLPQDLPEHVVFCRSLDHPNNKLVELLLAAKTARELGARKLTLVAPYMCYMRQDKAFIPGESTSQDIIGRLLAELFDHVITVDPHLHRTHNFKDAVPAKQAIALSATPLMCNFLEKKSDTILLGPDSESEQWVKSIAEGASLPGFVATKQRLGDREIRITLPETEMAEKAVVVVDDVVSSGETIAIAAQQCIERGANRVDVLVVHPLFAEGAVERLKQAGVGEIWSTDSISHPSNCIPLAELLGGAVRLIV
jgi:ribose-phosphate pyrophosphokinase